MKNKTILFLTFFMAFSFFTADAFGRAQQCESGENHGHKITCPKMLKKTVTLTAEKITDFDLDKSFYHYKNSSQAIGDKEKTYTARGPTAEIVLNVNVACIFNNLDDQKVRVSSRDVCSDGVAIIDGKSACCLGDSFNPRAAPR